MSRYACERRSHRPAPDGRMPRRCSLLEHDRVGPRARRARERRTDRLHARRADEHTPDRMVDAVDVDVGLERIHLAAVRVALHVTSRTPNSGSPPPTRCSEHDHARARAEDRHAPATRDRTGSTRPTARASLPIVVDSPPGITRRSTPARSSGVRTSRARRRRRPARGRARGNLPGARGRRPSPWAPPRGYQPRSCRRVSSEPISRPAIGSPRPCETFARTSGSWKCVVASTIARAIVGGSCDL